MELSCSWIKFLALSYFGLVLKLMVCVVCTISKLFSARVGCFNCVQYASVGSIESIYIGAEIYSIGCVLYMAHFQYW